MTLYPLTTPQQSIWNMEQYFGGSVANITGSVTFKEPVNIQALQAALNKTVEQHDALRIRLRLQDGNPMQYIGAYEPETFEVVRFLTQAEFDTWIQPLTRTPFDLHGSLYKFFIITVGPQTGLVVHLHHLTADAWGLHLLVNAVIKNLKGEAGSINSYLDYLDTEREYAASARREKDKDYFLSCFEQCGEPVYLSDKQAKGTDAASISLTVSKGDTARIQAFCAGNGLSPYALFMTALATYICRIKGAGDLYIGTAVLNRSGRKEKETAGMFVNTVPVLFHIGETRSALENLRDNAEGISSVFRHQKYQYNDLLKDIREKYGFTDRLYDVVLSYQNAALDDNVTAQFHFCGQQGESLVIHINDRHQEGAFHLDYTYQTELFTLRDIERLHGHLLNLILDMIENPGKPPQKLKLLSDEEYRKVIYDFNDTTTDYPKDKCIHQLFEEQVSRTPDAVAVVACDRTLTYGELNEQANRIARNLIQMGVRADDIVALKLPRKSYLLSAIMGVLKSGAAYLPIDSSYPEERINYILKDSKAKICITPDNIIQLLTGESNENPAIDVSSDNLCYCIYTSGSTGQPKGTLLYHKGLLNLILWERDFSAMLLPERVALTTTITFDVFTQEIMTALLLGKTAFLSSNSAKNNIAEFVNFIEDNKIELLFSTPSFFDVLTADKTNAERILNAVKEIALAGEPFCLNQTVLELGAIYNTVLHNQYGPAETHIISTAATLRDYTADNTIGRPIANTQIYILDKNLRPLPIGAAGELCISGDGVGRGYLNRPELTAEKFVPNPFIEGKRMYKTGDLARWREDGQLEYIGRMDNQVKIRGLRIELGEIEAAMAKFEGIRQAAVVDRKDESGRQYICAYYISGSSIDEKALRAELAKTLPRYMIPHFFTRLETFPTTPSGKTDRKSFPAPDFAQSHSGAEYIAPVTEQEKALVRILETVLGVSPVGMGDDFFDLGGDSLGAIEFTAKAYNEGFIFTAQDVYEYQTPAALLGHITECGYNTARYRAEDFADIHRLLENNRVNGNITPTRRPPGDILITGATGWLGAHVLDAFLSSEPGTACCLVRGRNLTDSQNRLNETLSYYFGGKYAESERIAVLRGDITEQITVEYPLNTVIHCAANVRHYGDYRRFHNVNVAGTENVIALAKEKGARLVHISTASVSGNSFEQPPDFPPAVFDETKLYIGQPLDNVYIRSKFEAEAAVLKAKLEGLDAVVVRVGNLTNRRSDLIFQQNHGENATLTRLKAFIELGLYPGQMEDFPLEFSPVDDTARAVIRLARHFNAEYSVFHAYNPNAVRFGDFIRALAAAGAAMRPVSTERFIEAVRNIPRIQEAFIHDIKKDGTLNYRSNITLNNDFTMWYLNRLGFDWPKIGAEYLTRYIEYFNNIGYWRA